MKKAFELNEDKNVNRKPDYHLLKNTQYALAGLWHAIKTESSFRLELFLFPVVLLLVFMMPFSHTDRLFLLSSAVLILIVELINSAIENVVDLVTQEIHPLAKAAKDIGSAAVMLAIGLHLMSWAIILTSLYGSKRI